jgi:hypothetical protein
MPANQGASAGPQPVPDVNGITNEMTLGARYFGAYHVGQDALLGARDGDAVLVWGSGAGVVRLTEYD